MHRIRPQNMFDWHNSTYPHFVGKSKYLGPGKEPKIQKLCAFCKVEGKKSPINRHIGLFLLKIVQIKIIKRWLNYPITSHVCSFINRSLLSQHLPYDYKPPALAEGFTSDTVQHNLLHLWACYCLYLETVHGRNEVCEAYETALCALKSSTDVQKMWIL